MHKPSPKELSEAAGISPSYASMILSDEIGDDNKSRKPPRALAIFMLRRFGWRHPVIAGLADEEIDILERVEPWSRAQKAA